MTRYLLPWPPSANVSGNKRTRKDGTVSQPAHGYWIHVGGRKVLTKYAHLYRARVRAAVSLTTRTHDHSGTLTVRYSLHPPNNQPRDSENVLKVLKDALVACNPRYGKRVLTIVALKDDSNKYIRREWIEWLEVVPGGSVEIELTDMPREGTT